MVGSDKGGGFVQKFDEDPLFCLAFHPETSEYVLGFASGRVACFEYGSGQGPKEKWSTKRHKSSCRVLAYTLNGEAVISAGSDSVVKKCDSATGRVTEKSRLLGPATAMAVTESWVVVGDENGNVMAFSVAGLKKQQTYSELEIDCIAAIAELPSSTGREFLVAGDTRLLHFNLKRPAPVGLSEDQEDELLCGCVASDVRNVWGMSEGVLTVWRNGYIEDQQHRIRVVKDGSVDALVPARDDDVVAAGTSEGQISLVNVRSGQILWKGMHAELEEVSMLDWDFEWRLVSGSMGMLKVWSDQERSNASNKSTPEQNEVSSESEGSKGSESQDEPENSDGSGSEESEDSAGSGSDESADESEESELGSSQSRDSSEDSEDDSESSKKSNKKLPPKKRSKYTL